MAKISINLLPAEFIAESYKAAKFYKVQTVGVAAIMLVVFLSSLVVALRILQSRNIQQLQADLNSSEGRISFKQQTEASLFLLKNRLTTIDQFLSIPSAQTQMYKAIIDLLPPTVSLTAISVDKGAEVLVSAVVQDANALDNLIVNLTPQDNNEGKISQVSIEGITRGRDGIYRVNLKIKPR